MTNKNGALCTIRVYCPKELDCTYLRLVGTCIIIVFACIYLGDILFYVKYGVAIVFEKDEFGARRHRFILREPCIYFCLAIQFAFIKQIPLRRLCKPRRYLVFSVYELSMS
jgi:hypothetical protein